MQKKGFLLFFIFLIIALSGCANSNLLSQINQIPEIQSILAQNPNATIKTAYLSQDYVDKNIEGIRADCGKQMENIPYYFISIDDTQSNVKIYTDEAATKILCIIKPARVDIKGNDSEDNNTEFNQSHLNPDCGLGVVRGPDGKCNFESKKVCKPGAVYDPSDDICYTCKEGYVYVSDDKSCRLKCGDGYCGIKQNYCINGVCQSCKSGYVLNSDNNKCYKECGTEGNYCTGDSRCFNGHCLSCNPGYILGDDGKCHQQCGDSGNYCTGNSQCLGGHCCSANAHLGADGNCYITTTTTVVQNGNGCNPGECDSNGYCCDYNYRYYCQGSCYATKTDAMIASNGRCVDWRITC